MEPKHWTVQRQSVRSRSDQNWPAGIIEKNTRPKPYCLSFPEQKVPKAPLAQQKCSSGWMVILEDKASRILGIANPTFTLGTDTQRVLHFKKRMGFFYTTF
jgi:hypothetical protein